MKCWHKKVLLFQLSPVFRWKIKVLLLSLSISTRKIETKHQIEPPLPPTPPGVQFWWILCVFWSFLPSQQAFEPPNFQLIALHEVYRNNHMLIFLRVANQVHLVTYKFGMPQIPSRYNASMTVCWATRMWHLEPYDEIRTAVNHVSPIAVGASTWVPIYCELNNKNECGSLHVTGMLKQCVSALMFCTQCHVRIIEPMNILHFVCIFSKIYRTHLQTQTIIVHRVQKGPHARRKESFVLTCFGARARTQAWPCVLAMSMSAAKPPWLKSSNFFCWI